MTGDAGDIGFFTDALVVHCRQTVMRFKHCVFVLWGVFSTEQGSSQSLGINTSQLKVQFNQAGPLTMCPLPIVLTVSQEM